jgi:hypothetical protein
VRLVNILLSVLQRGADAPIALPSACIIRMVRLNPSRTTPGSKQLGQAKPGFGRIGRQLSVTSTGQLFQTGQLAGRILVIQTNFPSIPARYPITTTVQP